MKVEGACHCGQIAYEAEIDPAKVSICQCTDCQVMSGSAFRVNVPVEAANFRLLRGQPKHYLKTSADSGNPRRQGFCPNCGSAIYATSNDDKPAAYSLRVGGLKQKRELTPGRRIWSRSALGWTENLGAITGSEKQ